VDAALASQWRDAEDKNRNAWYWGAVGRDVFIAAQEATRAIATLPATGDGDAYLDAVLGALERVRSEIRAGGEDEEGFRSGTIGDIEAEILRRSGRGF